MATTLFTGVPGIVLHPMVSEFFPPNGATGVAIDIGHGGGVGMGAYFSDALAWGSPADVDVQLRKYDDDAVVQAFTWTDKGGGIAITTAAYPPTWHFLAIATYRREDTPDPYDLLPNTHYYITIGPATVKSQDVYGLFFAGISDKNIWNFTTAP